MENAIKLISDVLERMLNILPNIKNCEEVLNFKKWHKEFVDKQGETKEEKLYLVQIEQLHEELRQKNSIIENLKNENTTLHNRIDKLKSEFDLSIQEYNNNISILSQDNDNQKNRIAELTIENDKLNNDLVVKESIIQTKNSTIHQQEVDNNDLNDIYNNLLTEKNDLLENLRQKNEILEKTQENNKILHNTINELTSKNNLLQAELNDSHEEILLLSQAKNQLDRELKDSNNKRQALDQKLLELDRQLPQKALLIDCQKLMKSMAQLPENLPDYYDTSSLVAFLAQCGQFQRLYQFWERCGTLIRETGTAIEGLENHLDKLLKIHNLASGDSPARSLKPEINKQYDYNLELRIASDGTTVRELLLPGLYNPGGELKLKALVILDK